MKQETSGSRSTHGMGHFNKGTEHGLGDLIGLGIRDDKEDQGRNEGVFRLKEQVEHLLVMYHQKTHGIQSREPVFP